MHLKQFLEVASSNQLIEVVVVELLIRGVVLLAKARVDNWIMLTFVELLFVFQVEEVT